MVNNSKNFSVISFSREKSRLAPLNTILTGRQTLLANASMQTPPVITFDITRPESITWNKIIVDVFMF